ncbi:hypothetical protein D3C81_1996180 [compost metagenome]
MQRILEAEESLKDFASQVGGEERLIPINLRLLFVAVEAPEDVVVLRAISMQALGRILYGRFSGISSIGFDRVEKAVGWLGRRFPSAICVHAF